MKSSHEVRLERKIREAISKPFIEWLLEYNIEADCRSRGGSLPADPGVQILVLTFIFQNDADAVAFKLRFDGEYQVDYLPEEAIPC